MKNRNAAGSIVGLKVVVLAMALVLGGAVVRPQPVEGAVSTCIDTTWADYNDCLVEAGSEFGRKMCDLEFLADYYLCANKLRRS
ncbi:MAG TPA: hypothetical protein VHG09_04555 [Longimicrobiales bacterium]|nr:hypothetical protein [Longimicrobiales bacterium]